MTELDPARVALVAGAAVWAGPGASIAIVEDLVTELAAMADAESMVMKRVGRILESSRFVAVVVAVRIEPSSTRAIVTLQTDQVTEEKPDGREEIRTDRTDQPAGALMERKARNLVGHKVMVLKAMEEAGRADRKVRVLAHLMDLGMPDGKPAAPPEASETTPAPNGQAVDRPGDEHNFLPFWTQLASKHKTNVPDLLKRFQGTPEGRSIRSLRTLSPYSDTGSKLELLVTGGRN